MAVRQQERERRRQKVSGRKRAEEHKTGFSSKCYKVPDGRSMFIVDKEGVKRIRIIPYIVPKAAGNPYAEDGELHMERTYFSHRDIGPDGDMYPCLKKTFKQPCPICDHRASMLKDPNADENVIKNLAPKERQLWNVYDLDNPDRGVQLYEASFHLFGKQLDARVKNSDEEEGYELYADPDDGMILKVGYSEESFGRNNFFSAATIDFKKDKPLEDEMLDKAMVLDNLLVRYTYDQLKEVFLQTKEEKQEQDEDNEGKSETSSKSEEEKPVARTRDRKPAKEEKPKEEDAVAAEPTTRRSRRSSTEDASRSDPTAGMPKASQYGVKVNMLADHPEFGKDCSVIAISKDETAVYILDLKDEKHSVTPDSLTNLGYPDDAEPAKEETKPKGGKSKKEEPKSEKKEDEEDWDWEDDK